MRYKSAIEPKAGDVRVQRKFAFWPFRCDDGYTVFLGYYYVLHEFKMGKVLMQSVAVIGPSIDVMKWVQLGTSSTNFVYLEIMKLTGKPVSLPDMSFLNFLKGKVPTEYNEDQQNIISQIRQSNSLTTIEELIKDPAVACLYKKDYIFTRLVEDRVDLITRFNQKDAPLKPKTSENANIYM